MSEKSGVAYTIRMPLALREALREAAWQARRSMNQEVLAGLWEHVGRRDLAESLPETCHRAPLARKSPRDSG